MVPSALSIFVTSTGVTCTPRLANVPYALAMSRGVTSFDPSTADGNGCNGLVTMPSFFAMSTAFCGPTCRISCAYSVLNECTVPSTRLAPPGAPSPGSALHTCHGPVAGCRSMQDGAGIDSE